MEGLNSPSNKDFSGALFKRRGMRFSLQIAGKIAAGATKANKKLSKQEFSLLMKI